MSKLREKPTLLSRSHSLHLIKNAQGSAPAGDTTNGFPGPRRVLSVEQHRNGNKHDNCRMIMHSPKMLQGAPPSGGVQRWHQRRVLKLCVCACVWGGFRHTLMLTVAAAFRPLLSSFQRGAGRLWVDGDTVSLGGRASLSCELPGFNCLEMCGNVCRWPNQNAAHLSLWGKFCLHFMWDFGWSHEGFDVRAWITRWLDWVSANC